ncbi:T9SS type A sorting domain-containing protein [bacterium]|nr:T9SS type A sorting domain-containing protein [bacterium]
MKGLTLAGLLCLALVLPALAADIELANGQDDWQMQLLGSDDSGTRIQLKLNRFQADGLIIDGAPWTALSLEDLPLHQQRGLPALPALRRSIAIADDAAMRVSVVESHFRDFSGMDIAPSKGTISRSMDPEMVSYEFSRFYESDAWFPAEIAKLGDPYIMRDVRGLVVELNPFQYNPATGTLRVYTEIVVEIESDGESFVNRLESRPDALDAEFAKIYSNHFVNYDQLNDRYVSVPEVGAMLVITYDAFHSAMLPYVDWKNQMGIPTDIVYVSSVGSTGAQIKSYIQNYYDSNGMTFVLLVGDAGEIPLPDGGSDPMYSLVAGDDSYPDIFVGRFSAENTAQVATQVERSIEYERDVALGESWMQYGMGVASNQGPGDDGEYDDDHEDVIRGKLLSYGYLGVDQIYDPTGTSAQVASGLNAGRGIVNYTGHGSTTSWSSTGFSNTSVNALVNNDMLPFICSVACNNGTFTGGTCFGEAWLRATNGGEPTGAIAAYMSYISQSWNPPMSAQDEAVDLLVADAKRTIGGLWFNGSCLMMDEYGSSGVNEFENWTIFGDPSLRVRSMAPSLASVDHFATVDPLMAYFTVNTDPGNLAAVSFEGAYIGSAFADAGGVAQVYFDGDLPTPGNEITLTVTGYNKVTHMAQVLVGDGLLPTCEVSPSFFNKVMMQDDVQTDNLYIANNGENGSTLYYSISMEDPNFPRDAGRNMTGSYAWTDPSAVFPGSTLDLTLSVFNGSDDSEWISNFEMDLPSGVALNTASDMTGGSAGDLVYTGGTGDAAHCVWSDPNGGYGQIYPDETGVAVINLTFNSMGDQVVIPYTIQGDIWGSDPHQVSGEIIITTLGPNVNVISPNGGEMLAIGQMLDIQWAAGGGPENVMIELSRTGIGGWEALAASVPAGTGHFGWIVEGPISADCRIKVCDVNDLATTDTSDGAFTIYRPLTWVQMAATSGDVPEGEMDILELTFDATGLPEGSYEATLTISSNAGDPVIVPISIEVLFDPTDSEDPPAVLALAKNHPNPFNPKTTIAFALAQSGQAKLTVFDVRGRAVTILSDGHMGAGRYSVDWDGRDDKGRQMASGLYFYKLEAENQVLTEKMLMLK